MREVIRFAWGNSSLGEFMVAMSDRGLIALELGSTRGSTEEALRIRFANAEVVNRQVELVDVLDKITRVIEEPGFDPELALDMRGTAYKIKVWSMLRALPIGETISYGALAAKLGTRDARDVTKAIASNPIAILVPCHRVIKKEDRSRAIAGASRESANFWRASDGPNLSQPQMEMNEKAIRVCP